MCRVMEGEGALEKGAAWCTSDRLELGRSLLAAGFGKLRNT